jgi:hypothetical protein
MRMCSLDGRSGTYMGAIPGDGNEQTLEGALMRTVLAWDRSAFRRASGWAGENPARSLGSPNHLLYIKQASLEGSVIGCPASACSESPHDETVVARCAQ